MGRNLFLTAMTISCVAVLSSCAPPGYSDLLFTSVTWPRADQALSIEQRIEVEGRLRALNYLGEPADGVISAKTRDAVRTFQRDIGAPVTGFLTFPLLDALRTNSAFLTANELKAVKQGAIVDPTRTRPTRLPAATKASTGTGSATGASDGSSEAAGSGSGGGSGGASGGAWN